MTGINIDSRWNLSSAPARAGTSSGLRGDDERIGGFTLVELLVVIMIVAILSIVVVLTMNIPELLRQSRDSSRLSDIKTLNGAVTFYLNELPGGNLGSSTTIYVSLPDKTISGNTTSTCTSLNLPTPPTGYSYQCSSPQAYRHVDGTGWMPVNLAQLSSGSPISVLPVDPANQTSTDLYYTYTANGGSYVFTSFFESQKDAKMMENSGGSDASVYAVGTNLTAPDVGRGFVGYWPMDEGTGTMAYDQSGAGNNGALINGPTWIAGKINSALSFNDSNSYVSVSDTSTLEYVGGNMTLAAWINVNSTETTGGWIFSKPWNGGGQYNYTVTLNSNNTLSFGIVGSGSYSISTTAVIPSNSWHYIAATVNSSGQMSIYIDGNLSASGTDGIVGWTPSSGNGSIPLSIGTLYPYGTGSWTHSNFTFGGLIDDARIYNRALSVTEIKAIYNAEK